MPRKPAAGKEEPAWTTGDGKPEKVPPHSNKKSTGNPMQGTDPMEQRCGAKTHSRGGAPCKRKLRFGQKKCRSHGGASPQALEAERRRTLEQLWPLSVRAWERALDPEEARDPDNVMMRAAEAVADRTGHPGVRRSELGNVPGDEPFEVRIKPSLAGKKKRGDGKRARKQ